MIGNTEVEVLFYHLIFHVIGYEGPYTDYASPGCPVRRYPKELESNPVIPATSATPSSGLMSLEAEKTQ